ncbi:uncharacterized protein MELLADRAFT_96307 [Melampsora larici-populina 98AG31]|uniref:Uncharacterized protein n=1 Tax=Melampsora larici-populina (strain 98AG31 / pathotype 3-4-7) TaxID=747676 RepID=F4REB2_MELLP|nr:uncharacterized protein MELLADRAFT_96307 [Melampsora larici-populina 98AG31]EGG09058.1 hypothetical protein MELLADRAFT_96307 [Melampsora larici-populina 98AG31]
MSIPNLPTSSTLTGSQVVSNLESLADSFEQRVSSTQTTGNHPTSVVHATSATNDKRKRKKSNKNNKSNKKGKPSNDTPSVNVADIVAMNMSSIDLRALAELHAQSGMTQAVLHSVLKFHEEMETLKAIKALKLGITVSTMEEVFGKYLGVRQPSAWNGFLQSELAKAVFKAGKLSLHIAMRRLSAQWATFDKKEKASYQKVSQIANVNTREGHSNTQDEITNTQDGITNTQDGITNTQDGITNTQDGITNTQDGITNTQDGITNTQDGITNNLNANDTSDVNHDSPDHQSCTNILTNPRCLKKYKETAEKLLDQTLAKLQCISIAKSNHFEMILIAVSNHIGKHHFQVTRNTVGLNKAINVIYESDGINKLPAQLQSFLVGKEPNSLAIGLAESKQKWSTPSQDYYVFDTVGLKHWPWSKCNATLAAAGRQLKLLPGARSVKSTFKMPSSNLNAAKVAALDADLKANLIQLVPIQTQADIQLSKTQPDFSPNRSHQPQTNSSTDILDQTQDNQIHTLNRTQNDIQNGFSNGFNRVNTDIMERRGLNVDPMLFATV